MTKRGIIRNNKAVSNQIVSIASISIFIIVVLAVTLNSVQQSPDYRAQVDKNTQIYSAEDIVDMLADHFGSSPDGSSNWEDNVDTINPLSVGLRIDPNVVPEEIEDLSTFDPDVYAGPTNNPPNVVDNTLPVDGALDITTQPTLVFDGGDQDSGDTVTYEIFLDANVDPSTSRGTFSANGDEIEQQFPMPIVLNTNTLYYWKVIANDGTNPDVEGEITSFTTDDGSNTAPVLSGPQYTTTVDRDNIVNFYYSATDAESDVMINVDWGDGFVDSSGYDLSGTTHHFTHSWSEEDTYPIEVIAYDEAMEPSNIISFNKPVVNSIPYISSSSDISLFVAPLVETWFLIDLDDNNPNDWVMERIDWGDGDSTEWPASHHDPETGMIYYHTYAGADGTTFAMEVFYHDDYAPTDVGSETFIIEIFSGASSQEEIPCCFPAGTMIEMSDGTLKAIEDIEVGDLVLSYDEENGIYVQDCVKQTVKRYREGVYDINDGLISPTNDHPLYVRKADGRVGWAAISPEKSKAAYESRNAMKLEVGDEVFTLDGFVEIYSIEFNADPQFVYTFVVETYHNYFANEILTSNGMDGCQTATGAEGSAEDPPLVCCFPAGTKILMSDGKQKSIENVVSGDIIKTYDFKEKKIVIDRVLERISPVRSGVYNINDGLIKPTNDHPLYVRKADGRVGWAAVDQELSTRVYSHSIDIIYQLEIGDELFSNDDWIEIKSIEYEPGEIQTYTLLIKNNHQFFANNILAKNGGGRQDPSGSGEDTEGGSCDGSNDPVCCFPAGTKIQMANGETKSIEELRIGDFVLTYDLSRDSFIPDKVENIYMPIREGVYNINNGFLSPTNDHPLYVRKADGRVGWAAVNPSAAKRAYPSIDTILALDLGDTLFTMNGWEEIVSIEYEPGPLITYSLGISNHHHYFANGVLAKNIGFTGSGDDPQSTSTGDGGCVNPPNCFIARSKIKLSDGSLKNIEDMKIGDIVESYDVSTGQYVKDEITGVYRCPPDKISLFGNYHMIINEKIGVTPDHRLYIDGKWTLAGNLEIGSKLSDEITIFSIEKIDGDIPTYNLETKTYHNYLVQYDKENFIIAHNDYIVGGYEEKKINEQTATVSGTDSIPILSFHKTRAIGKLTYTEIKEIIGLPENLDFIIRLSSLYGSESYIFITPDNGRSTDLSDYSSTHKINVLVSDPTPYQYYDLDEYYYFYDYAILEVEVF